MNKLAVISAFIFGAAIGALSGWKYAKTKFERIADEEIASMKQMYEQSKQQIKDLETYSELLETYTKPKQGKKETPVIADHDREYDFSFDEKHSKDESYDKFALEPYVITPEVYGEEEDYEGLEFTYYADGVLTDDGGHPLSIEEIEDSVGLEALTTFGVFEDDAVYVRNDRLHVDYEILRDQRNYADLANRKPHEVF